MTRPPPISTRINTPFPYTTRVRSERTQGIAGKIQKTGERENVSQWGLRRVCKPAGQERGRRRCGASASPRHAIWRDAAGGLTDATRRAGFPRPPAASTGLPDAPHRSEEHTSELPSLMRISYAVFCLNKNKTQL